MKDIKVFLQLEICENNVKPLFYTYTTFYQISQNLPVFQDIRKMSILKKHLFLKKHKNQNFRYFYTRAKTVEMGILERSAKNGHFGKKAYFGGYPQK